MPKGNKCFITESVKQNPALSSTRLFCCIPTYPNISVPLTLTRKGTILSSNGTEYERLSDWVEYEFVPHCPKDANKSVIIKSIHSKRDFFTEPCRRGKSFIQLVEEYADPCSVIESGENIFSKVTETSHLFVSELILYALMRVTGFKASDVQQSLVNQYTQVLNKCSNTHINVEDINNYLTNYRLLISRRETFQQITSAFCYYNANELISMLNHEDYDKTLLTEADGICNNFIENLNLSTLVIAGENSLIALKYIAHFLDKNFFCWQFLIGSDGTAFLYDPDNVIDKKIIVKHDLSWKVVVNLKTIDMQWAGLSDKIKDISDVTCIIKTVDSLKLCKGLRIDQFLDCVKDGLNNDYYIQDEQILAIVCNNCLFATSCATSMPPSASHLCTHCTRVRNVLYNKRYRLQHKDTDDKPSKFTTYKNKSKTLLKEENMSLVKNNRIMEVEIKKLKKKLEEYQEVLSINEEDLRTMLECVEDGLHNITEDMDNQSSDNNGQNTVTMVTPQTESDVATTSDINTTNQEVVQAKDNLKKISKQCKKRKLTWPLDM